jgi:hypothetical protein
MKFPVAILSLFIFVNSSFAVPWTEQQKGLAKAFSDSCFNIDLKVTVNTAGNNSKLHMRVSDPMMHRADGAQIKEWTKGVTRDQMEALLRTADFTEAYITELMAYINGLSGEFPARLVLRFIKPTANEPIVVQMNVVSHDARSGLALDASKFLAKCVK